MKILEINKFYFIKGGADKHFLDLIDVMEGQGNEVAVFSMRHPKNKKSAWSKYFISTVGYTREYTFWQKIKGVFRMFYSAEMKRKINKLLDDFRPDIVHIHNIYHQLSPAMLFEIKKRGIPIVMTVHDFKLINPNYNLNLKGKVYERCRNKKYYQCFLDKCVKNSYAKSFLAALEMYWHNFLGTYEKNINWYIAPSEFVKNKLAEGGVKKEKIAVIPHFITNQAFTPILGSIEVNVNTTEKYALYFGRISKEKGVDELMKIFERLNGKIKLYLAGEIENDFKIKESENVKYLGYLNQEDLLRHIRNSEFTVSASGLPETFGLIVLESIGQGKPFVGLKSGAYAEIIENGINGFLANDKNELYDVINKIANGQILFNNQEIRKLAGQRYNKQSYYHRTIDIFRKADFT